MDKETIQQIAAEVVARLPFGDRYWLFLIINIIVMALTAAIAAFAGSYFRTRGQHLATKADFESLQDQLRANTQLVETIKSEVGQRDWARREWTNVRRAQLEALVEKTHECEVYLDRRRRDAMDGKVASPERDPVDELYALSKYFPELKNEVGRFAILCREQSMLVFELAPAVKTAQSAHDVSAAKVVMANFYAKWNERYPKSLDARRELVDAASSLLKHIINVDEQNPPSDER
jgi:hypothetical protein